MKTSLSNLPSTVYDVFISFRGIDGRYTLIEYLYEALCNFGITTFMDDKKLSIGDCLSEKLVTTIEESLISIVVLSENYASSKWCMRELMKIIECMDKGTNQILPVFYHVDPHDVRNQFGSFKKSFDMYEKTHAQLVESNRKAKYTMEEVKRWREILTKVGNLSGVVVEKHRSEVESRNKIINQIFDMLQRPKLVAPDKLNNLVDILERLSGINNLLDFKSNEARFIGIVGMGGIGKTTIAHVFYDNMTSAFGYNSCFLTISGRDLVTVQRLLLSQLLRKEDIDFLEESEGANMIKNCLSRRKVLIVLDGVEETRQLENLAGNANWFGPKSLIMITTRNKDVLSHPNLKVEIYHVKPLDYNSSLSLFCKHAFGDQEGGNNSNENFINLSKEIVKKIEGHPQALERIGSFLYGQNIDVWREELESLVLVENKRLFNILKISFDQLEPRTQKAFLDLTCFFNGKSRDKVIEILRSLGYSPHSILQLLCDRYLIEIKYGNKIYIPNLIQAMGQQIEREAPQRSRIWLRKDAFDIFDEQHGVKYIEGVVLEQNGEKQPELVLKCSLFKDMSSLKILDMNNVKLLPRNIEYLSNQLRLLHWHGYPSHSLPLNFEAPYLFELFLPLAQTTRLWNGLKRFEKLKVIDASDSHNLVETPNLSQVPNLERLILRNCIRLHTIDNSIISLNHLLLLDFTFCIRLKTFTLMGSLRSHTTLLLAGSGLQYPNNTSSISQVARQPRSRTLSYRVRRMFKRFAMLKCSRQ